MNWKFFSWVHPCLYLKKVPYGKGVFTRKNLTKDEILAIYGGHVFAAVEESTFPKSMQDYALQISPEFVIGIRTKTQLQTVDYINHSCSPNAGFRGQIVVVAMRDITKDEEITLDYCMAVSKPKSCKKKYCFACKCGSPDCRKIISWDDWKNPRLQKKYHGYFQWYLEEMIRKSKFAK